MTTLPTAAHGKRISALFARYGEAFTLVRAGINHPCQGLFAALDGATAGTYFDANESVGLLRPALALYLDGALPDPPLAADVFFRDGRLWTVRKTQLFRQGDTPLLLLALCD
jgi:hypothetical protein